MEINIKAQHNHSWNFFFLLDFIIAEIKVHLFKHFFFKLAWNKASIILYGFISQCPIRKSNNVTDKVNVTRQVWLCLQETLDKWNRRTKIINQEKFRSIQPFTTSNNFKFAFIMEVNQFKNDKFS